MYPQHQSTVNSPTGNLARFFSGQFCHLKIGGYIKMTDEERIKRGLYPNEVWRQFELHHVVGIIRLKEDETGASFAHGFLTYYMPLFEQGKCSITIVMIDYFGTYLGEASLSKIAKNIGDEEPNPSRIEHSGPYHWLDQNFELSAVRRFASRMRTRDGDSW